ncbi:MAG: glycine--tRNA ligase [Planctomycetota bacterium]|jgi:glycyl-tRNA synthetase
MNDPEKMEKIVSLAKRRGFVFQSSEIYDGMGGCWDYGPLGVELKRNVKEAWWTASVRERDDMVGLDASILMHPLAWKASGHIDEFSDPLVDCKQCKHRFRADDVDEACPDCGGEFTEARRFNLMFKTFVGPVEDDASVTYLRPETAQGIFVNFLNVVNSSRVKIPFGIAQIGKSFRNEITPRNFTFRTREFEQMEIEFFVKPGEDMTWFEFWRDERFRWYRDLGIREENLRLRDHGADELSHYSKCCVDVEYLFPFGWSELEGVANRTDYDLRRHQRGMRTRKRWVQAGGDAARVELADEIEKWGEGPLSYFEEDTRTRFIPYVIEPSAGADRATLAFFCDAYHQDEVRGEKRTVLKFHPRLAPVKVAVFPLLRKLGMPERARKLYDDIKGTIPAFYDEKGAIGRRYRRQDEAGTPFCVTVDGTTLEDATVTVRDRDSMDQERIPEEKVCAYILERLR